MDSAGDTSKHRLRAVRQDHPRHVPHRDGAGRALAGAAWPNCPLLSEGWQEPRAGWAGLHVAYLFPGFNLSDPRVEEALYVSTTMRGFAGSDLDREAEPDETPNLQVLPSAETARPRPADLKAVGSIRAHRMIITASAMVEVKLWAGLQ
jgi:hypothetical protein